MLDEDCDIGSSVVVDDGDADCSRKGRTKSDVLEDSGLGDMSGST